MSEDWRKDLQESAKDFLEIVWPKIKGWFGDAELILVEAVTEGEMALKLDMFSNIDYWIVKTSEGIRGLASRVQYDEDYSTFTIRKERLSGARTEYAKLKEAIEEDRLYPYWWCHSYISKKSKTLLNSALCRTKDLMKFIEQGRKGYDYDLKPVHERGAAWFIVVSWTRFRTKYEINIYNEQKLPQKLNHFAQRRTQKELNDLEKELIAAVKYEIGVGELWPRMFLEERGMTREEAGLTVRRLAEAGELKRHGIEWRAD